MQIGAGKFIDFTQVLWLDIILNAGMIINIIGLTFWIGWGIKERRQGVRGAVRKAHKESGHANGWKPRTRWVWAALSTAVWAGWLVLGAALLVSGRGEAEVPLWLGGICGGLWTLAMPLFRPLPGDRPQHSEEWADPADRGNGLTG
jgi:hypothetical protein